MDDVHADALKNALSKDEKVRAKAWQHINSCPECSNKMDEAAKRLTRAIHEEDEESET